MRFISAFTILLFVSIQSGQAGDGKDAQNKISGSNEVASGESIEFNIPIIYKKTNNTTKKVQACAVYYDKSTGNMSKECCRDIKSDDPDRYVVEKPADGSHCFADVDHADSHPHVGSGTESGASAKLLPGVCQNYHGVGQPSCNIKTQGSLSYVWCPASPGSKTLFHAELYFGPAGIDHVGNITNVPSAGCPN